MSAVSERRVLEAERLRLVALDGRTARAVVAARPPRGAIWGRGYPLDGSRLAADLVVRAELSGRELGPWGTYQMVRRTDGLVVGDCGFHGPPSADGAVVVGYGVVPGERRQGFATEALLTLVAFALSRTEVSRVLADTTPDNEGSWRAMLAAGMQLVGQDQRKVHYAIGR